MPRRNTKMLSGIALKANTMARFQSSNPPLIATNVRNLDVVEIFKTFLGEFFREFSHMPTLPRLPTLLPFCLTRNGLMLYNQPSYKLGTQTASTYESDKTVKIGYLVTYRKLTIAIAQSQLMTEYSASLHPHGTCHQICC